eukprot:394106_1
MAEQADQIEEGKLDESNTNKNSSSNFKLFTATTAKIDDNNVITSIKQEWSNIGIITEKPVLKSKCTSVIVKVVKPDKDYKLLHTMFGFGSDGIAKHAANGRVGMLAHSYGMYYTAEILGNGKPFAECKNALMWTLDQEIEMQYTTKDNKIIWTVDPIEIGWVQVQYVEKIKNTNFIPIISIWGVDTQVQVVSVVQE